MVWELPFEKIISPYPPSDELSATALPRLYLHRLAASAAVCMLTAGGCSDLTAPHPYEPGAKVPAPESVGTIVAQYDCTVSGGSIECTEASPRLPAGVSAVILGQNQVKMASSNVVWDSAAGLFTMDVTVQNVWNRTIGTADGTTVAGMKVFFHTGPTPTSYKTPGDSGSVRVHQPDGHGNFSAANQPYYGYPNILLPTEVTPARSWGFEVDSGVNTWSFSVLVITRYPGEPEVPVAAPDSVPASVYDTTKIAWNDTVLRSALFRNLVVVSFHPWATAEDRMAAVNRANGTVVGGRRLTPTDGLYLVRFSDNGTTTALHQALDRLSVLPQVEYASPEYVITDDALEHFRPEDLTNGWKRDQWGLVPDAVAGANWGMEAIWAPHAWSCSVGHAQVPLAVVDREFHAHADMSVANSGWSSSAVGSHGLSVASIAAAAGNNDSGIAGVTWKSNLRYYNIDSHRRLIFFPYTDLLASISQAIRDDNRVINISIGRGYYDDLGYQRRPVMADSSAADVYGRGITHAIERALPHGDDPLLVFSAGNYGGTDGGGDARLNGRDVILEHHPTRVLIVAAAEHRPGAGDFGGDYSLAVFNPSLTALKQGSNHGLAVQIAAPGLNVGVLGPNDGYKVGGGTSYSAPAVAGAATLLLGLDHRLTAAELKTLLLRGATEGGVQINNRITTIPMLNAHHSLRLVAARTGAGLCGNPVWRDANGVVHVRRGENWGTGSTEALFTETAGGMSPQHLTMKIGFSGGVARRYDRGSWVADTIVGALNNPSYRSRGGFSHEGDSLFTVQKRRVSQHEEWFDVMLNGTTIFSLQGPLINHPLTAAPRRCVMWATTGTEWDSCYSDWPKRPDYRTSTFSYAYSSARGELVLAVARDSAVWDVEEPFVHYGGYYQRNYSYEVYVMNTHLYFIPVADPSTYRTLVSAPGRRFNDLAFSADGRHLAVRSATRTTTNAYTPIQDYYNTTISCAATFRGITTNDLPLIFSTPVVTNTLACYPGAVFAGGASYAP